MAKTTLTVLEVPGSSYSGHRPYTHAIIGRGHGGVSADPQEEIKNARRAMPLSDVRVLQWSMSFENAFKAVGVWARHHSEVRVVECVAVAKAPRGSKVGV